MKLDDQLTVLSNRHRRRFLFALTEESPQTVATVSSNVVEADGGNREYALAMHHRHLPQLEDYGLIDWDQRTSDVTKGSEFDAIEPLLTTLAENYTVGPPGKPPD